MAACHSVDFLELINLNMNSDIYFNSEIDLINHLKREGEYSLFAEACGIIGTDSDNNFVYRSMRNRSKEPDKYFMIDPYDYLSFIKKFKCLSIFHTHLAGNEEPSDFDSKTSENCCYPFIIYSVVTEKFFIYEPHYKDYDVNILSRIKDKL